MFPVGAMFERFPPKTGTNMLHPRPRTQSLNWSPALVHRAAEPLFFRLIYFLPDFAPRSSLPAPSLPVLSGPSTHWTACRFASTSKRALQDPHWLFVVILIASAIFAANASAGPCLGVRLTHVVENNPLRWQKFKTSDSSLGNPKTAFVL